MSWSTGYSAACLSRPFSSGQALKPGPSDFNNPDEMNCDVALSITAETRDAWRSTLTLESMGATAGRTPMTRPFAWTPITARTSFYSPGTMIELSGDRLDLDKSDLAQGVFFRSGSDPEVRATVYGTIPPSISVLVPATLSDRMGLSALSSGDASQ